MAIAKTVESCLERNRVPYAIISHPHSISSRETAAAATVPVRQIAKPVILGDARGYVMVVVPGDRHVEIEKISQKLNRRLRLAAEAEFAHLFGDCEAGAIPPLGPSYGIETIVDDRVLEQKEVCFVAGDHDDLICVDRDVFRALLKDVTYARISCPPNADRGAALPAADELSPRQDAS